MVLAVKLRAVPITPDLDEEDLVERRARYIGPRERTSRLESSKDING